MTGAQRPLVSANRDADRKAFEVSKARRGPERDAGRKTSSHDVYSRACTHSSVGRDIELGTLGLLQARAAPGVILVQPLISLSFSMDSILSRHSTTGPNRRQKKHLAALNILASHLTKSCCIISAVQRHI